LQSHHISNLAFTSSVTSRSPATVGKAISTQGLPQVQSLGGKGFGGPAGGNKDLSGYLGILIKGLESRKSNTTKPNKQEHTKAKPDNPTS